MGKTRISVLLVDGIVIGGTSWPVTEEQLRGWVYSLDGQTLEELHGIDYPSWERAWTEKYSDDRTDELPFDIETVLLTKTETVFANLNTTNWSALANQVHPEKGLFFSFYAAVGSPNSDEVHFTKENLGQLEGTETYIWGYDMGDYAFEFSVNDYTSKFLVNHSMRWDGENSKEIDYDVITFNDSVVQSGGIINTIPDFFPDAKYVEYYSTPPSEELWHQWQALRFIYEEFEDEWYLIGIVRDVHSP
ncbi:hypothetical protein H1D32_12700 [Anaerobacillus sp. CMMVII]|uniref:hypothetical protein n=1 Tax=Anaerobacillus sp. CMMVII TaxID=2755588 RepID=UPI0021B6F64D|nr:hypothetical protein [Anaerobacillus sp. CMMVII]MCT8138524.1 hypothetical protein [Anaerobacillus sp. CMMVII]